MRILFDSRKTEYKSLFGTILEQQECVFRIDIPEDVGAVYAELLFSDGCDGTEYVFRMDKTENRKPYERFAASVQLPAGLYFYYFRIYKENGSFRLFKQGNETNMELGKLWQLSCIPASAKVPEWARNGTIYQIFPDRFCREGSTDLSEKIRPYTFHGSWSEEVEWRPNEKGEITNTDFYGGNLKGIISKLPYLSSLGVTMLYLNPIFLAWSTHRYDTANYMKIDPMLGTEEDFRELCRAAHALGMHVILDGVFSHTGSQSPYFQAAKQDRHSDYYKWYIFKKWPDSYFCWWDFKTLPCLDKNSAGVIDYLITGEDSVVAHWIRAGADGWRLDVVDELPDRFVRLLKERIRKEKPDALLIGEVWEDASNKIAYNQRRTYFTAGELDSVMNYPFRTAILNYITEKDDGSGLAETVRTLMENYPREVLDCCMTLLSTHDTPRILTALTGKGEGSREENAVLSINPVDMHKYLSRLKMASALQYMLPGSPSLYYGDEAGMQGGKDPFSRRPYPWNREDRDLRNWYRLLGEIRRDYRSELAGEIEITASGSGKFAIRRGRLLFAVQMKPGSWKLPKGKLLLGSNVEIAGSYLSISARGCAIMFTEEA